MAASSLAYLNSYSPPWAASVSHPADLHDRDSCEPQTMTSPTEAATHYAPTACQGWARARGDMQCVCAGRNEEASYTFFVQSEHSAATMIPTESQ
jgi:hypothetical protein